MEKDQLTCCENPQKNWYKNWGKMKQTFWKRKWLLWSEMQAPIYIQCYRFAYHSFIVLTIVSIARTVDKTTYVKPQQSHLAVVLLEINPLKIFSRQSYKATVWKLKGSKIWDPGIQFS